MRIIASPRGAWLGAAGLLAAMIAGCATPPSDPAGRAAFEQNNDPLEPLNRETLDLNLFIDRILLKPVTKIYIAIVPEAGRNALRRALDNMKEPVVVINNVLQGEVTRAGTSAGRFVVNSTAGVGGLFDVAKEWGLEKQSGDFGQTLYAWGLPEGPYLMAPLLGPGNPRDLAGMGVDAYIDPFSFLATAESVDNIQITRFVLDGIDQRARVMDVFDDLQKNSLDFYAQLRSLSQQRRAAELRHGAVAEPGANFYDDPSKGADPSPSSQQVPQKPPRQSPQQSLQAKPVEPRPKVSANPPSEAMSFTLSEAPRSAARSSARAPRRHYAAIPRRIPSVAPPVR